MLLLLAVVCAAAAPVAAQCPLSPLPVGVELVDSSGTPDPSFAGIANDVALAPGRVVVACMGDGLFPFQSATPFKGAVSILTQAPGGSWALEAKLRGPFAPDRSFGRCVAFAGPEALLVGDPGACPVVCVASNGPPGRVLAYERVAGTWTQTQVLTAPVALSNDSFGVSVAGEGNLLAVGAPSDSFFGSGQSGAVHVFERTPAGWQPRAQILPPGPQGRFGAEVALGGGVLVVADPGLAVSTGFPGAVHVFRMQGSPSAWSLATTLLPEPQDSPFARFGESVATDGLRVVVGVPGADLSVDPFAVVASEPGTIRSGRVDVFEELLGNFVRTATIAPPEPVIGGQFGATVALDGTQLVVGAPSGAGRVYAFELSGSLWAPLDVIEASTLDGVNPTDDLDGVGRALALLGGRVVVGAPNASFPDAPGQGAAASFELGGPPCDARDLLGAPGILSVALGGEHVWNVRPGPPAAGSIYFVVGSASGTQPGFVFDDVLVPLNGDFYLATTIALANQAPFVATLGTLDAAGRATAAVTLPPAPSPSLVGLELFHSAGLFDATSLALTSATVPARLALVP